MTHRERILRAARGDWPDRLPWVPRIDIWYNSNLIKGTFPPQFHRGATIEEIADYIGGGYHMIVPDFLRTQSPEDMIDRGLGVYRLKEMVCRPELMDVEREIKKEGDTTTVFYHTPVGSVSFKIIYTEEMKRSGVSASWISEHLIKEPRDYAIAGYIFRNIKVIPAYENYLECQKKAGEKGVAIPWACPSAGPMHHILKHLIDPPTFYLELYDHPKELRRLCEDMEPYFDQIFRVHVDCPAEIIHFGGNYDETITYPPLFRDYMMPYLQKFSDMLHARGKLLLSHCDGEMQGLLDLIPESGIDIAEAICPKPMTKVSIASVRRAFKEKVTIFGGIPSVALLEENMSDEEFKTFMRNLFCDIAPGDRFILGVSDTTPPGAKFERLLLITEMVETWGKLPLEMCG